MSLFWKRALLLISAGMVGLIAIIPYITVQFADVIEQSAVPLPIFWLATSVQTLTFIAISVLVGLKLLPNTQLQLPFADALLKQKPFPTNASKTIQLAYFLGTAAGIAIILFDYLFMLSGAITSPINQPEMIWQRSLVVFYGGITEELLLRLGVMTVLIWLLSKLRLSNQPLLYWSAIILSSILFGLLHLPATAALITITPIIIFRAVLLNSIGGVIFGWLFWKKGLIPAMVAHFAADVILHVLFPLLS